MRRRATLNRPALRLLAGAFAAALFGTAQQVHADEGSRFGELGRDIYPRERAEVSISGYMRTRSELLYNLDLDRGPTPSGAPLFPVSRVDPSAQTWTHVDMRSRNDIAVYAPGSTLAVKLRLDILDNVGFGSKPDGVPATSTTQLSPENAIKVRRAWGEALLPFGLLVAGRMGTHWGLGMVAHGGECLDCDSADASDRIGFVAPLAGHIWTAAFDISGTGPQGTRPGQNRFLDLERRVDVRTLTFAFLKWRNADSITRRSRAGKATFDYGAYFTHRWQNSDVPASYLPVAQPIDVTASPNVAMARGFSASAFDAWLRLNLPDIRVEAEFAALVAEIEQPSLIPGVLLRDPVRSTQFGAALETDFGKAEGTFTFGFDAGYASGDPSPGFGVVQRPGAPAPKPGDLDGPQAYPPRDRRADNFRFHPDYRVDRILFREIIGAVTDAAYLKPHARWLMLKSPAFDVALSASAVASMAMYASSTPGGKRPLGVELDPSLTYRHRDGFSLALDYAVLFPLAGLDGLEQPGVKALAAKPAQLLRARIGFSF